MAEKLRYLAVHGLGDQRGKDWHGPWRQSIEGIFDSFQLGAATPELDPILYEYDALFEKVDLSFGETTRALARLIGSGIGSVAQDFWDFISGGRSRARGRGIDDTIRWTAGYVVAWLEDDAFRAQTRADVHRLIKENRPHLLLAHSLGSLITYDALVHPSAHSDSTLQSALESMTLVVFGSQIGNPFVRQNLVPGRRLHVPGKLRYWIHLFNDHDKVLTNNIRVSDSRFFQLDTYFNHRCHSLHHCPVGYFEHASTIRFLWSPLARQLAKRSRSRAPKTTKKALLETFRLDELEALNRPPQRPAGAPAGRKRALVVGINRYPNPNDCLEGCVNDAFLMSEVLQECGFPPDEIRLVLDDRATTGAVLERLEWLLDDARPGDHLVFYFSGHGARTPRYDEGFNVVGYDESLVTHDFDWSPGTGITDKMIKELYPQLPYGVLLTFVFDCCHSGGMHRNGGAKIRGLNPPDDVRHRAMRWDTKLRVWREREIEPIIEDFGTKEASRRALGKERVTYRLGVNIEQRVSEKDYNKLKKSGPADQFPFMPVVLYACRDDEFAYEYRHGVQSYGAFTYVMAKILREPGTITYNELVERAAKEIRDELKFDQNPDRNGPESILDAPVPHPD